MRHQVRKSNRRDYSREHMQIAVASVLNSFLNIRESARINGVGLLTIKLVDVLCQVTSAERRNCSCRL